MAVSCALVPFALLPERLKCSSSTAFPSRFRASSSSSSHELTALSLIQNSGVIACLRANSPETAVNAASAALDAGISVLEITMSTPGVFEILQHLVQKYPSKALGVGTVLNANDARKAISFGAKFLMSPAIVKGVMIDVKHSNVLYIPGAMTPTEILSAYDAGAKIIKIYPVSALGGTRYISALKKPFHFIPMVASQGITIDSIGEYITNGVVSVVLSDAIFNKLAISRNDFDAVYQLAQSATLRGRAAVDDSIGEYITNGVVSVVLSDAIFNKLAISRNDFDAVYQLAQSATLRGRAAVDEAMQVESAEP